MHAIRPYLSCFKHSKLQTNFFTKNPKPQFSFLLVRNKSQHVARLIEEYRCRGHLAANLSPLIKSTDNSVLRNLSDFELNLNELITWRNCTTVEEIVNHLKKSYCEDLSSDLSYLPTPVKDFMAEELENLEEPDKTTQENVLKVMIQSQILDQFLATKFPTLKKYGLEGAEAMLAFFYRIFELAQMHQSVDIAMTHRGRLNLLIVLLNVPPSLVFKKIKGGNELNSLSPIYTGDVLSHLQTNTLVKNLEVNLLPNPSHLEIINPVSMGFSRGCRTQDPNKLHPLNIQVHGDAALSGQGINQETLMLSQVPGFSVKGSIHLIVNNEIGFTTPGNQGRSTLYTSNLAKVIDAPVIHCNGFNPREVIRATTIAYKYSQKFNRDIFIDLHCIRVHGHNEMDDPTMTNPVMYKQIKDLKLKLTDFYVESLDKTGNTNHGDHWRTFLNDQLKKEGTSREPKDNQWKDKLERWKQLTVWDTGFSEHYLRQLMRWSVTTPDSFRVHQRIADTHVKSRLENSRLEESKLKIIDWAAAEALSVGSLLLQQFNVRLCGQDVGRGTFAQRNFELIDQETDEKLIPLNNIPLENIGKLEVVNSILSEEAVLAFEYGYSIRDKNTLVLWEAQFGDFFNGAQTIIDTCISSGEAKWGINTSLTILLPHGLDGAGPEHSSCRIERFLQLSSSKEEEPDGDIVNMFIAWPSTPAQYFHLLRQQMCRDFRVPLIVVTPKMLLRDPLARSSLSELTEGNHFKPILSEDISDPETITKIIFTSGQMAYTLKSNKPDNVMICSLEMLCPFPAKEIKDFVAQFPNASDLVWCQEEPRNQGAWSFVRERFLKKLGISLKYFGRVELPVPAYGLASLHKQSLQDILQNVY